MHLPLPRNSLKANRTSEDPLEGPFALRVASAAVRGPPITYAKDWILSRRPTRVCAFSSSRLAGLVADESDDHAVEVEEEHDEMETELEERLLYHTNQHLSPINKFATPQISRVPDSGTKRTFL